MQWAGRLGPSVALVAQEASLTLRVAAELFRCSSRRRQEADEARSRDRGCQTGVLETQQAGQEIVPTWRAGLPAKSHQRVLIKAPRIDQESEKAVRSCCGESNRMQAPRRGQLPQPVDGAAFVDKCLVCGRGPATVQKDVEVGKQAPGLAPGLCLPGSAFLKIAGDGPLQVLPEDEGLLLAEHLGAGIESTEDVVIQQGMREEPLPPTAKRLDTGNCGQPLSTASQGAQTRAISTPWCVSSRGSTHPVVTGESHRCVRATVTGVATPTRG